MGIRLSDITRSTRKITVDIGAHEPLEIEYRAEAYTPELEALIDNAEKRPASTLAQMLSRLVVSWTLEEDDGRMYPPDEKHLAKLPMSFLLAVFTAIAEDMRPNPPKAGD